MSKWKEITKGWTWVDYGIMSLFMVFAMYNRLMPILLILTGLSLIMVRNSWSESKKLMHPKYPFIWFILYFVMHGVGMLYTENIAFGQADLGMKLSFLLIPIFFIFSNVKIKFTQLVHAYLFSLFLTCIMVYTFAAWRSWYYPEDNQWSYFKESYLSFMMHRSYFATYLALGTLMAVKLFFTMKKRWKYLGLAILFSITTVLTFSKAGILILLILLIPMSYYLITKFYSKLWGIIVVAVVITGSILIVKTNSTLNTRFTKMMEGLSAHQVENNTSVESSASRLIMWNTSLELIRERPILGVGTGDVKDALNQRNREHGNLGVVENNLNSHNQYLNSAVQLGLLGLFPLILALATSLWIAIKRKNIILVMLVSCFALTMLFESFLETQAGIIPVTLFTLVFTLKTIQNGSSGELHATERG